MDRSPVAEFGKRSLERARVLGDEVNLCKIQKGSLVDGIEPAVSTGDGHRSVSLGDICEAGMLGISLVIRLAARHPPGFVVAPGKTVLGQFFAYVYIPQVLWENVAEA